MLLFSSLVYLSFSPAGVVAAVFPAIIPPGARGSKAHMATPCGGIGAMIPVMLELALHPWRSGLPTPVEVYGRDLVAPVEVSHVPFIATGVFVCWYLLSWVLYIFWKSAFSWIWCC